MSFDHRIAVLANPYQWLYRAADRLAPASLWNRAGTLAAGAGFTRPYLMFSFDCDTDGDADVVLAVDDRLRTLGIVPSYAVPGGLLLRHLSVYRKLAQRGSEFLNHGFREHVQRNPQTNELESCYFYETLSEAEVISDVTRGDKTLRDALGIEPRGFRTPHFGTFQKKKHLRLLHTVLAKMNYFYSSSTLPYFAYRYGALLKSTSLLEIPVSGSVSRPMRLMDSWNYYARPDRKLSPTDFQNEALQTAKYIKTRNWTGILNYYADPSHIAKSEEFYSALSALAKVAEPITFLGMTEKFNVGALKALAFNH